MMLIHHKLYDSYKLYYCLLRTGDKSQKQDSDNSTGQYIQHYDDNDNDDDDNEKNHIDVDVDV